VNLLWSVVIIVGAAGVAIAAMLLVRRSAPDGGYFEDGDRASGVFGVLATGFSVLLGLIVFLAFTNYDNSRVGAETEALTVAQQVETAQFFSPPVAAKLTGELVCYARSVAGPQWELMEKGQLDAELNPWGVVLFHTFQTIQPDTPKEEAAYGKWLDQTSDREIARQERIHGASGVIPASLWIVLLVISVVIFVYMLFFADHAERAVVQSLLIGSVVTVIVVLMLLVRTLNDPFSPGVGSIKPVAMERTLEIIDKALAVTPQDEQIPCDDRGNAL
jgi:hypothetical protein